MKKVKNKKAALVIVALILVALTAVSATYAWIDDVKLVEFDNDNLAQNGAPLKTGVDINAKVNITENTSEINLGNMLTNDDLTYEYTEESATKRHTKYDGSNASRRPDWDYIDENKGYFYESGDMHLSPCYSNGETFYFPKNSSSSSSFREGNKDDENVNYISYTLQVSSPNANVDFWFRNEPSVATKGSTNKLTSHARYAITVDGQSHVYSATGTATTCNAGLNGTKAVEGVRKTSTYTYNHADNTTDSRGKNSNTLFSIKKGDTVNLNVKIWLEPGFDANNTAVDVNFQLVSSWAYTRTIKIVDKTTNGSGSSWIGNDSAKLYLVCPEILSDYAKDIYANPTVSNWSGISAQSGYSKAPFYLLSLDSGSSDTYTVNVPLCFNNEELVLYRCRSTGWAQSGSGAEPRSKYNVNCWNWWSTYLPNTYKSETYTLYGSSYDDVAEQGFGGTPTNKGYGTWGAVEKIEVFSHYDGVEYATYDGNARLYLRDFSDEDTSGEVYTFVMYRGDNGSGTSWKCYVPTSSSKLQFDYYTGGNITAVWGYNSWNNTNPQRRPLKSTGLYSANSTVYHFAQHYGTDDYRNGWGYWEGADTVYLIKSGFLSSTSTTAHAYMYNSDSDKKQNYPGEELTRLKDTSNNNVSYTWNGGNTTAEVWYTGTPRVYKNIIFNNGYGGNGNQTGNLALFPGCFYQVDGNKWYGALDDAGRAATTVDSGGGSSGGDETGGDTIDGYTIDSGFVFKINNNNYTVYQNAAGTEFKVRIPLAAGANWTTVQKSGRDYGLEQASQSYNVPSSSVNLYLTNAHRYNFSFNASQAGNYIATFTYDNGNTGTIKISSVLKES